MKNNKGYTKHYFTEEQRVCSRIGGGFMNANYNVHNEVPPIYPVINKMYLLTIAKLMVDTSFNGFFPTQYITDVNDIELALSQTMKNEITSNDPEPTFYYNSDHLGSSSYITDGSGTITQKLAYLPFGESWIDVKVGNPFYTTSYKFNGKEKDPETGFNYFGARYYWDEGSF